MAARTTLIEAGKTLRHKYVDHIYTVVTLLYADIVCILCMCLQLEGIDAHVLFITSEGDECTPIESSTHLINRMAAVWKLCFYSIFYEIISYSLPRVGGVSRYMCYIC